ncbi:MAG TPA: cytochrome c [Candidatus Binatia bacterium]|nr:cytochrome c [Candidatus Binatia bacterium]
MNRSIAVASFLVLLLAAAGCGSKSEPQGAGSGSGATAVSPYDSGPRAGESPVEPAMAEKGEGLFKTKGCTACHAYDKRITGPALKGVTQRRTAAWMEQQILHPEVMTKQDPISKQLLGTYMVQMSNQGLKPEEAKAVIEYLKKLDEESSETQQAGVGK